MLQSERHASLALRQHCRHFPLLSFSRRSEIPKSISQTMVCAVMYSLVSDGGIFNFQGNQKWQNQESRQSVLAQAQTASSRRNERTQKALPKEIYMRTRPLSEEIQGVLGLRAQSANTRPKGQTRPYTCFILPGTLFLHGGSAELPLNS